MGLDGRRGQLYGREPIWYERVSPRLIDFILGSLGVERGAPSALAGKTREAVADGIPEGAVFTIEEAAGMLKVPVETLEQMVSTKEIGSIRFGGVIRIPRRAVFAVLRGMTAAEFDEYLQQPRDAAE